jgi:hypothetical protein
MKFIGYKTSTDYIKLWELAHKQDVICIASVYYNDRSMRISAHTRIYNTGVSIDSFGCVIVEDQDDFKNFELKCRKKMIEWIIPHEMEKECKMEKITRSESIEMSKKTLAEAEQERIKIAEAESEKGVK